jgi:hypothetical protein
MNSRGLNDLCAARPEPPAEADRAAILVIRALSSRQAAPATELFRSATGYEGRPMAATEWVTATDPHRLLSLLGPDFSRRKLRLFVCASVRHLLPPDAAARASRVLAFAERLADGEASIDIDAEDWVSVQVQQELSYLAPGGLSSVVWAGFTGLLQLTVADDIYTESHWAVECLQDSGVEATVTVALLREIFGNPFRAVGPTAWFTGTIQALARQIYETDDFSALPILADALQDAGCDNADILDHCRGPGPHVHGCWVVDLVLGKE